MVTQKPKNNFTPVGVTGAGVPGAGVGVTGAGVPGAGVGEVVPAGGGRARRHAAGTSKQSHLSHERKAPQSKRRDGRAD